MGILEVGGIMRIHSPSLPYAPESNRVLEVLVPIWCLSGWGFSDARGALVHLETPPGKI